MQKPTIATLLVGSPKGPSSTSNSLGTFLLEKLQEHGVKTQKVYLCQYLNSTRNHEGLLKLVDESDLIVLAIPLYVDSLHSQTIETLELIAEHEKAKSEHGKKSFMAIANSGFPEAKHSDTALAVCRLFARQAGFNWAGGLAMGGGGMIAGTPLEEMGGQVRNQKKALEIAAEALAQGEPVPKDAVVLMSKLGFPRWLYIWMGNRGWKQEARKHISLEKMYDQPFREA
jgi:multimeric flavodoxin WrbA